MTSSLYIAGIAVAAALLAAGCAGLPEREAQLAAKAAVASSRAQHLEVALLYEQRAREERAASATHRARADFERRTTELLNQGRPTRWAPSLMRSHCELQESMHARAAADNAAEAQRHWRMAEDAAP